MSPTQQPVSTSTSATVLWTNRIVTALVIIFLLFDSIAKILKVPEVMATNLQLGVPESQVIGIGILLLVCTAIYLIPQTAILGALLLTAYLGGAVAINTRAEAGLFPMLFPIIFGGLVWLPLYLREPRLRTLLPLKRAAR